jgi:RHS repeat-associated protein
MRNGTRASSRLSRRTGLLFSAASVLVLSLAAEAAHAQTINLPPVHTTIDANGVDLVTGAYNPVVSNLTIGNPATGGLALTQMYLGPTLYVNPSWNTNFDCFVASDGTTISLNMGLQSETFTISGSTASSKQGSGDSIVITGSGATIAYTVTMRDGSVLVFNHGHLVTDTHPNGQVDSYNYAVGNWVQTGVPMTSYRLQSVTTSLGYQIHIGYSTDTLAGDGSNLLTWTNRTGAIGINNAVDYCGPTAGQCTGLTVTWPSVTYGTPASGPGSTITDTLGRKTTFTASAPGVLTPGLITGSQLPSGLTTSVTYDANNRVTTVSNGTGTWHYLFTVSGTTGTAKVLDPTAGLSTYVSNLTLGLITSATDPLSHTTTYAYDSFGRLTGVTLPEGNGATVTYDSTVQTVTRGNPVTVTRNPKPGSGLTATSVTAAYASSCTFPAWCNQPTSTTDAIGNAGASGHTTSYVYDNTTGVLLSVTPPAPTSGATQPQTRYSYTPLYSYYLTSPGVLSASAAPIETLVGVSTCQTTASCAGTADEVKTTISHGTPGTANNLLPTAVAKGAGDGSLTATTSMTYTPEGDLATMTGPLGAAQTTNYFYDADRERTGIIYPNPGGSEGLPSRAEKYTYGSPDGLLTEAEAGTDTSQTDSTFASFTSLKQVTMVPDSLDRPSKVTVTGSGTTFAVTQFAYDPSNRVTCTAVRMNPSTWGALPASACTLATNGSYGPDRVTMNVYDADSRVTQRIVGYGTAAQSTASTSSFSANGMLATVLDANSNLTTYAYDGFDRPVQITYPSPTKGAGVSNASDYETYAYDANDNPTSTRKRSGDTVGFVYDALNRLTEKTVPTWSGQNVFYSYDLLNRLTAAVLGSPTGSWFDDYTYDALGRVTVDNQHTGPFTSQYDAAGDRTALIWPDGYYAAYVYDNLQRVTAVYDSARGLLAQHSYDGLGHYLGSTYANGAGISRSYDGAGRLATLSDAFVNTAANNTFTFGYDPANGIVSRTATNDTYTAHAPTQSQTYVANGLNQYTSVSGGSYSYDTRGNLASDGTRTLGYDVDNHLVSGTEASATTYYAWDPLGRRGYSQAPGAANPTYMYYDDSGNPILEWSSVTQRRYVPSGIGDTPVVWYEGADESTPRWLHSDGLGSPLAYSDASGIASTPMGYDAYGLQPSWTAAGRYTYTGQTTAFTNQLIDYKARMYDPNLGRFTSADPIGQAGGVNIYAYVENDPANNTDPSGLLSPGDSPGSQGLGTIVTQVTVDPPTFIQDMWNQVGAGWEIVNPDSSFMMKGINIVPMALPQFHEVAEIVVKGARKGLKNYLSCLSNTVGGDGSLGGTLGAGALFLVAGSAVIPKPGVGFGGGGPSGGMTTPLSIIARTLFGSGRAPVWLRDLGSAWSPGVSRTITIGGNVGRIASRGSGFLSLALFKLSADQLQDAETKCAASSVE